jgi:glycosyltransferase involved in cell wall biosynthesis
LVHQILPEILKIYPNIRIHIVGADTPQDIFALACENVLVSGFVEDIRTAYSEARIFVAPLFSGAGLQNKILEAMSMQIPCITTSIVNISVQAKMESEILIANSAAEFISKIQLLLMSEELQTSISTQARKFVMENFCWDVANEKLNAILV